jgi:hypothetical protein
MMEEREGNDEESAVGDVAGGKEEAKIVAGRCGKTR